MLEDLHIFYLNYSSEFKCHYFDTERKIGSSGHIYILFSGKQISELNVWELKFSELNDAYDFIRGNNIQYSMIENLKCPVCSGFGRHCTQFVERNVG